MSIAIMGALPTPEEVLARQRQRRHPDVAGFAWDIVYSAKESSRIAVIGTAAINAMNHVVNGAEIGVIFTDAGGNRYEGMGRPGRLFGSVVPGEEEPLLAVALGTREQGVDMTWASRTDGLTVPLSTIVIAELPRGDMKERFPNVPIL